MILPSYEQQVEKAAFRLIKEMGDYDLAHRKAIQLAEECYKEISSLPYYDPERIKSLEDQAFRLLGIAKAIKKRAK
jgi:hypothetical protein